MMTEKNLEAIENRQVSAQVNLLTDPFRGSNWYQDIILYLENLSCPPNFTKTQRRSLQLQAAKYYVWQGRLGWRSPAGVILRCADLDESKELLKELHSGVCGGHFSARTIAHKIMRASYYWPTLFRDTHSFVRACEACQRFEGKQKLPTLPLDPVIVEAPFQQWGLDFIGQFSQSSSAGHTWILVATDYFTRWVEAVPLRTSSNATIVRFLEDNILTRFSVPQKITTDNASVFRSVELLAFCSQYGITLAHASNYYPQGIGLAESSNKNLIRIIRKTVGDNKRAWDSCLKFALWADRITRKRSTGKSPFELVYGLDAVLPINMKLSCI
jgi:hypothetical protein